MAHGAQLLLDFLSSDHFTRLPEQELGVRIEQLVFELNRGSESFNSFTATFESKLAKLEASLADDMYTDLKRRHAQQLKEWQDVALAYVVESQTWQEAQAVWLAEQAQ